MPSGAPATTRSTVVPWRTGVSAAGSLSSTVPSSTVSLTRVVMSPTSNPSASSSLIALSTDCPTTCGTGTSC